MERDVSVVFSPCKFSTLGCQFTMLHADKTDHEVTCTFRPYYCPCLARPSCKWQGTPEQFMPHLVNQHAYIPRFRGKDGVFVFHNIAAEANWVVMHNCFDHHFLLHLKKMEKYKGIVQFFAVVQLIGSSEQAEKFKCRLELCRSRNRMTWEGKVNSTDEELSLAIGNSHCLVMDTDVAELFARDGHLPIGISILMRQPISTLIS